ncbi:MAG TPA: glycosyltransferase family 4 protein [Caulobacteraceae bacterium]|nr:glycosyltransferase family 4 protein [Caulobacteraceae bacterium]
MTMAAGKPIRILTYCPLPYNGGGPSGSCVNILANIPAEIATSTLVLPRATKPIPSAIEVDQAVPAPLRWSPWRPMWTIGMAYLNRRFAQHIDESDPATTVAYFWPDPPLWLVHRARKRGLLAVREMINCYRGSAKTILDHSYDRLGLPRSHTISEESVRQERAELALYDYVFASRQVVPTLHEAGVSDERILPAAFGWNPARFLPIQREPRSGPVRALFVGIVGVRKGIPDLLKAWELAGAPGELLIAGGVEKDVARFLRKNPPPSNVKFLGFVRDMRRLYLESDFFIFPTLEEGGPQVTCEAAGCGLPVLTTDMGAGRLVSDGRNGLIVESADAQGLAAAISRLARDADLRRTLGENAAADAERFTYAALARARAEMIVEALGRRHSKPTAYFGPLGGEAAGIVARVRAHEQELGATVAGAFDEQSIRVHAGA